jgi:ABC-2 type transport system permease protein
MIAARGVPTLTSEMMKLLAIARITLRSRLRYLWDMAGSTLFLAVVMFVFVRLWTVTYQSSAGAGDNAKDIQLAGFSLAHMIWYLVATETIIMSMTPIHRLIEREIRDGDVAIRLNKPYSFLGYHWSVFLGEGMLKALILISVGGLVAALMVGGVSFAISSIPALLISFLLTSTLNFLFGAMIGLLAFWTEDVTGFYFIFDRVKWLLGGFLMPITLFPDWLLKVVEWLPFSLMIYQPARLAVHFDWTVWAELSMKQVGLLVVLAFFAQGMYRLGVRRLDVNGG